MFKKKITKRINVLDELVDKKPEELVDAEQDEESTASEPQLRKLVKKDRNQLFSSSTITDEYGRTANEITEDLRFKSRPELIGNVKGNATASNEVDADTSNDAKAIYFRNMQINKDLKDGKLDKNVYRGQQGYQKYIEKSESDISNSKYTGSIGPIRAPSNIRVTCRIDYNPSLCKDYHDTGYCCFGDSCIYLHDRGDYKSGWEMEQDWEAEQKEKAKKLQVSSKGYVADDNGEEVDEDDGKFPHICSLCQEDFKDPIKTNCKDYFCERCITSHFKESKICPVCDKKLDGNFNVARDLTDHLKKRAERKNTKKIVESVKAQNKKHEDFDLFGEHQPTIVADEEDLKKLVSEFRNDQLQQKIVRPSESDWLL